MTMAKVENGSITQIGLPAELRSQPMSVLKGAGWKKIVGTPKPTDETQPGYRWEYGAECQKKMVLFTEPGWRHKCHSLTLRGHGLTERVG